MTIVEEFCADQNDRDQWLAAGLNDEERQAFRAVGCPLPQAQAFAAAGISPAVAAEWMEVDLQDAERTAQWIESGLSPGEARAWTAARVWDADAATLLSALGVAPQDVASWRGASPGDIALYLAAGLSCDEAAALPGELGANDAATRLVAARAGVNLASPPGRSDYPREAVETLRAGHHGLSPAEWLEWRLKVDPLIDLRTVGRLRAEGATPDAVQAKANHDQVAHLRSPRPSRDAEGSVLRWSTSTADPQMCGLWHRAYTELPDVDRVRLAERGITPERWRRNDRRGRTVDELLASLDLPRTAPPPAAADVAPDL